MPLPVVISAQRRRLFGTQKKTWRRVLPEFWREVSERHRLRYYTWLLAGGESAMPEVARHLVRLPGWAWQAMRPEVVAAFAGTLAWMLPKPDCGDAQPFEYFDHDGRRYYLPKANGENLTCIEYPLADEYLQAFQNSPGDLESPGESTLLKLVATLCREREPEPEMRLRRDDQRRPLHSRAEVTARAERLKGLHPAHQAHVMMWFAGMKQYLHKTYKNWLFEPDDEEEDDEAPDQQPTTNNQSPNFGWWGIFQDVAEAGAFGTSVEQVLQAPFHDVCVWLVRQRVKADEMRSASGAASRQPVEVDEYD